MAELQNKIIKAIDRAIAKGNLAISNKRPNSYVTTEFWTDFVSASESVMGSLYNEKDRYYQLFEQKVINNDYNSSNILAGIKILENVRHDLEEGMLIKMKELLIAEVHSDYLEMAKHLLDHDYKDSAAVIIGTILEGKLRQLCTSHDIDILDDKRYLKAEALNQKLYKKGIYSSGDLKRITANLDIRNDAAHGNYSNYTKEQIHIMLLDVQSILQRLH